MLAGEHKGFHEIPQVRKKLIKSHDTDTISTEPLLLVKGGGGGGGGGGRRFVINSDVITKIYYSQLNTLANRRQSNVVFVK